MPDFTFETIESIPEELREGLKANDDGKFVVNLVPNARLKEFRDNNVIISKERDDIKTQYASLKTIVGEDTEVFTTELADLRTTAQKVKDGDLTAKGDIENEVTKRLDVQVESMKSGFEKQLQSQALEIAALKESGAVSEKKFRRTQIDRAVTNAVLDEKSGAEHAALPQILREAYDVFIVEDDGTIVPKNGEAVIYGSDGSSAMSATEWLANLKEKSPFFFKPSQGGGANGGKDTQIGDMSRAEFNKLPATTRLKLINASKA